MSLSLSLSLSLLSTLSFLQFWRNHDVLLFPFFDAANPLIVVDAIPLGGDYDTSQGGKGGTRPKEGCCHCRKDPNSLSYCGLGYGWFL